MKSPCRGIVSVMADPVWFAKNVSLNVPSDTFPESAVHKVRIVQVNLFRPERDVFRYGHQQLPDFLHRGVCNVFDGRHVAILFQLMRLWR